MPENLRLSVLCQPSGCRLSFHVPEEARWFSGRDGHRRLLSSGQDSTFWESASPGGWKRRPCADAIDGGRIGRCSRRLMNSSLARTSCQRCAGRGRKSIPGLWGETVYELLPGIREGSVGRRLRGVSWSRKVSRAPRSRPATATAVEQFTGYGSGPRLPPCPGDDHEGFSWVI